MLAHLGSSLKVDFDDGPAVFSRFNTGQINVNQISGIITEHQNEQTTENHEYEGIIRGQID